MTKRDAEMNSSPRKTGGSVKSSVVSLADMPTGKTGKIVVIQGGRGMLGKLDAMGVRVGKEITKVSSQWMKGPVHFRIGGTQTAMGFMMASKILIELS